MNNVERLVRRLVDGVFREQQVETRREAARAREERMLADLERALTLRAVTSLQRRVHLLEQGRILDRAFMQTLERRVARLEGDNYGPDALLERLQGIRRQLADIAE